MSSIPNSERYENKYPLPEPSQNDSPEERNLSPLAEERQIPTGLENPFWKPDR
ncbi:MAG: hypothetical protein JOY79_11195 [Acidobacteriaceae bacterium]|nr:hypothetical protein [Acidobacteriaceae bacterium]